MQPLLIALSLFFPPRFEPYADLPPPSAVVEPKIPPPSPFTSNEAKIAAEVTDKEVKTKIEQEKVEAERVQRVALQIAANARRATLKATEATTAQLAVIQPQVALAAPTPAPEPTPLPVTGPSVWDNLSQCESSGRWNYDGPSGFDGGLQFLPATWNTMNTGYAFAWQAPREVQIEAAQRLQARAGWGQWPACSRKLGLL